MANDNAPLTQEAAYATAGPAPVAPAFHMFPASTLTHRDLLTPLPGYPEKTKPRRVARPKADRMTAAAPVRWDRFALIYQTICFALAFATTFNGMQALVPSGLFALSVLGAVCVRLGTKAQTASWFSALMCAVAASMIVLLGVGSLAFVPPSALSLVVSAIFASTALIYVRASFAWASALLCGLTLWSDPALMLQPASTIAAMTTVVAIMWLGLRLSSATLVSTALWGSALMAFWWLAAYGVAPVLAFVILALAAFTVQSVAAAFGRSGRVSVIGGPANLVCAAAIVGCLYVMLLGDVARQLGAAQPASPAVVQGAIWAQAAVLCIMLTGWWKKNISFGRVISAQVIIAGVSCLLISPEGLFAVDELLPVGIVLRGVAVFALCLCLGPRLSGAVSRDGVVASLIYASVVIAGLGLAIWPYLNDTPIMLAMACLALAGLIASRRARSNDWVDRAMIAVNS